jgi:iron complex transport system permease protein
MAILIVGLMFGSFTSAIVVFSRILVQPKSCENLHFGLGNLGNLSWSSILILTVCVVAGLLSVLVSNP